MYIILILGNIYKADLWRVNKNSVSFLFTSSTEYICWFKLHKTSTKPYVIDTETTKLNYNYYVEFNIATHPTFQHVNKCAPMS